MRAVVIQYADNYRVRLFPVPRRGPMQLAPGQRDDGYGEKIHTDWMIQFRDGSSRWYRVYATCVSNAVSYYVIRKGKKLYCKAHELTVDTMLINGVERETVIIGGSELLRLYRHYTAQGYKMLWGGDGRMCMVAPEKPTTVEMPPIITEIPVDTGEGLQG